MSGSRISDDRNTLVYEINQGRKVHIYKIQRIVNDGFSDELGVKFPDKIRIISSIRDVADINCQVFSDQTIIIDKTHTAAFSHAFRSMADVMEEWYKDESN